MIREVEAFGLRPASAEINPANGRTLINFDTVFYTTAAEYQFRLPNLGPGVDIIATPARYTWHFGDGQTKVTDEPGRPYPHLDITHEYENTGTRQIRVDVDYQVQWNAGGGWQTIAQTIPGQQGPSTSLTVLENDPVLSRNR
ncbi:MAG: PKD domain-containing protein [Actinopolymorphaceae bacterium]